MVDGRGAQARVEGAGVSGEVECRYYGRDFSAEEIALLRALIAGPARLTRHALSKEFCRRIGWFKADGGLKDMMARIIAGIWRILFGSSRLTTASGPKTEFWPVTRPQAAHRALAVLRDRSRAGWSHARLIARPRCSRPAGRSRGWAGWRVAEPLTG